MSMERDTAIRPEWLPDTTWPWALRTLEAGGRDIVYTDTGGDGPVLLMVHVGLWSLLWQGMINQLAGRFRCITLDVPGSGLSSSAPASLPTAVQAIGSLIDNLDLQDITLVVHDLGGLAGLAAVGSDSSRRERVRGIVAINTFAWQPGMILRLALYFFGSLIMRELNAWTGWLAWASATRFGVGRRWTRDTKRVWRQGLRDRTKRRYLHRMFVDAARYYDVAHLAEIGAAALADRPLLTVFGQFGDYFRFRRRWRRLWPAMTERAVPWGLHFPMADNPELVAETLRDWHVDNVAGSPIAALTA